MFRTLTISILTGILAAANAVSEEKSGDNAGFADTLGATQPDGWTQKAARLDHLRRAIEHLEAAGLTELAAKVDEHAETEVLHAELEQKRIELQKISDDIQRLERLLNRERETSRTQTGKQVLTSVKVIKVDLTKLDKWGLNVGKEGLGGVLFDSEVETGDGTLKLRLLQDGSVNKLLDWLCENEVAKIVAEPVLATTSGKTASFFSGGQIPVITRDGEDYSINYRHIGTQVQLVPNVTGDKIHLEIRPTISRVVPATFEKKLEGEEPDYESRSFNAEIELQSGQTVAIGGLTESSEPDEGSKPRLLPKSKADDAKTTASAKRTEYIFLVTPKIVESQTQNLFPEFIKPTKAPRALPAPNKDLKKSSGN